MENILLSNLVSKSIELGRVKERKENFILSSDNSSHKTYEGLKSRVNTLSIEIEVLKSIMVETYQKSKN